MRVASAGQCVNSASSAIAGSSSSQPWMVAVRREVMQPSAEERYRRGSDTSPRRGEVGARSAPGHGARDSEIATASPAGSHATSPPGER